jgi:hypothetical protein
MHRGRLAAASTALAMSVLLIGCGGSSDQAFPTGEWTNTSEQGLVKVIDFRADGTLTVRSGASSDALVEVDSGTYSATADTITFAPSSYCGGSGTYRWSLEDGRLAFVLGNDDCRGRVDYLDGYVFTPVGA